MPLTVKKYNCYCLVEEKFVSTWADSVPKVCPNNKDHPIDENNIAILDSMNTQSVFIQGKAYDANKIGGQYFYHGNILNIGVDDITFQDVLFKIPSTIFGLTFMSSEVHRGDFIDITVNPNTLCGTITAPVNPGDTVINMDANVLNNMKLGWYLTLDNGQGTTNDLGMILDINAVEGTVTVDKPAKTNFAPWLTMVQFTIYMVKDFAITEPTLYSIGYGGQAGVDVPGGTVFRMVYHNNSEIAKVLSYRFEYFY